MHLAKTSALLESLAAGTARNCSAIIRKLALNVLHRTRANIFISVSLYGDIQHSSADCFDAKTGGATRAKVPADSRAEARQ
jgi:hypothetical protein